jgi:hypothetical protein
MTTIEQCARKVSSWPKRSCKLAHAFLREYSVKRLKLAHFLGQLGVFLTMVQHIYIGAERHTPLSSNAFGVFGTALQTGIGVSRASTLKMAPKTPNASYGGPHPRPTMRLEITGPRSGSLNGKRQSFVGGRSGKLQTHRTADLLDGVDELLLRREGVVVGLALVEVAVVLQHRHLAALCRAEATEARKVLGWPRRCRLARAFQWEHSDKELKLAQHSGQLGVSVSLEGLEAGVDAAEERAAAGFVDAPEMRAIEAALRRTGAWGDNSVSGRRSYSRAKAPGTSAGAFPMALSLSGEGPSGPQRGAKGSCGTPTSPCLGSPGPRPPRAARRRGRRPSRPP